MLGDIWHVSIRQERRLGAEKGARVTRSRLLSGPAGLAAIAVCSLAVAPAPPILASTASRIGPGPRPFTTTDFLAGVAAISATDAWAVGGSSTYRGAPLIVHWDGTRWAIVRTPRLRGYPYLASVAATSTRNAWAVGAAGNTTLILHWNGTSWRRVPSPSPTGWPQLLSVSAISGRSAWAVGSRSTRNGRDYLMLHWNGKRWRIEPDPASPVVGATGQGDLVGVAASSASNVWAAGTGAPGYWTMFDHWNGSHWKQLLSPNVFAGILNGVAIAPHGTAWAVGHVGGAPLIMHWNGSVWRRMRSPHPPGSAILRGVTATSGSSAWAVGAYGSGQTLILRWNGHAWGRVPSPNPTVGGTSSDHLAAVATYPGGAWAVGYTGGGDGFILNWDGAHWR